MQKETKGLLIPHVELQSESYIDTSAWAAIFSNYYEIEAFGPCSDLDHANAKAFAHVKPIILRVLDENRGFDIVFLNPYELLSKLNASIVLVQPPADYRGPRAIPVIKFGDYKHFNQFLREYWCSSYTIAVSNFIAIAKVKITGMKISESTGIPYAYGTIERLIRKIYVDEILEVSKPLNRVDHIPYDDEKAKAVLESFMGFPLPWPWAIGGLVIDKARKWVTAFNPPAAMAIKIDDMLEVRIVRIQEPHADIPVLVVKKLSLINDIDDEDQRSRLGYVLLTMDLD